MKKSLKHNLTRIAFTEAILKARNCNQGPECPCEFCSDLVKISNSCGITFNFDGDRQITHAFPDLIVSKSRDALEMMSMQNHFKLYQRSNIFSGFMELPEGAYPAYQFFSENYDEFSSEENMLLKRQTVFILVSQALPDSYLTHVEEQNVQSKSEFIDNGWEHCCRVFEEINMPLLDLPPEITENISPGCLWTDHFGPDGVLDPIAGYGLEFGRNEERNSSTEPISLADYLNLPSAVPEYFAWWDRSNGYNTCGGFVSRSWGLFVSQQWFFGENNHQYIKAFNSYLAPYFRSEPESEFDHVIVVYSAYREDAYIASTDPRSWDSATPTERLLLPLPEGYGLVGNWRARDADYVAPQLSSYDSDIYMPRLRAATRYLEECLKIERKQSGIIDSD